MKTNKNHLKEVSQILELEDNKLLIELYGQHDENLTKIENNFGIHISYRGNIIEFRGNQDACSSASKFISNVYNKLASGKKINGCLLYTSPSPRDGLLSRMPSSA